MRSSSGQSPTPSADDAPDAIGVEDARKTLPTLINAAQNGNSTTIRFDTHCAKIVGIVPGTDLGGWPRFGVRDTREKLSALVTSAAGQPSVITRNGKPVALLISAHAPARPATSRVLAAVGDGVAALLDQRRQQIAIGIPGIDQAAAVLRPGRLTLVVGAPGSGTSLLALSAAATASLDAGTSVLYAASGPTRSDVTLRLIASRADVDYQRLRAGTLTPAEQQQVAAFAAQLRAAPLLIDDGTGLDAAAIAEVLQSAGSEIRMVIVDRLQSEPHPHRPLSGANVPAAVRDLAHLAQQHQIPILAALDSPDHSAALALGADLVLALTRAGTAVELHITEADLGVQTAVPLHLDGSRARLLDRPASGPAAEQPDIAAIASAEPAGVAAQPQPAPQTPQHADPVTPTPQPAVPVAVSDRAELRPAPVEPAVGTEPAQTAEQQVDTDVPELSEREIGSSSAEELRMMIRQWVLEASEKHGGDVDAIEAALKKRAIPNVMELFARSRVGSRYDHTAFPPGLDILKKKSRNGPDDIWEARPKWVSPFVRTGLPRLAEALDINGAYLSAFKCHLPIGKLQHNPTGSYDRKTDGVVLITPPAWDHPHLPNPLGDRKEAGPYWITTATLRLLLRVSKLDLCDVPQIHESWVAYSSENLLETLRVALRDARQDAIQDGDEITVEYVKTMYSKFVSTIGESNTNSKMRRPDWMHLIRSQAFSNLWWKAYKAHEAGLEVVGVEGTDELRLVGDWRSVKTQTGTFLFPEGRGLAEVKTKSKNNKMIGGE
ncbi:DnaB-like helicase C-terminal domain-containing protein [Kitasatospora sp. NPDC059088]|uniref:DnaB-like helicase C-terminal domain-containing protein n=1 Tax=Kitasatospora sp. NPDC059088 TaxID=3346722 RepID=UPI00368300CE